MSERISEGRMGPRAPALLEPWPYFALAFLVTVGAFWPSFFSKIPTTDAAHLLHGFSATAWMAIPVIQSWLAVRGRFQLHRHLGRVWLALAPVVVISGLHMVQLMILTYQETKSLRLLKFAFLDIAAMILFVVFLGLALWSIRHHRVGDHARYMACTALFALEPALERVFVFYVPGVSGFEQALYLALASMVTILSCLLLVDWSRQRHIFKPYAAALAFFLAMYSLVTPTAESKWFQTFAVWFAQL